MFFYDKYGGHIIGVVWKQQSFKPRPFKVWFHVTITVVIRMY